MTIKKYYQYCLVLPILLLTKSLNAQEKHHDQNCSDSLSIKSMWEKGHVDILIRDFTMVTQPFGDYQSSWANVFGGTMNFHSGEWKGISIGIGGSYILKLSSSDLTHKDSLTGRTPRFERQLLDITNPNNHDIDGLEDLYLMYHFHNSTVEVGRFNITTPLVNPHDGRMRPNSLGGAWMSLNELKKINFGAGFFYESSPRSTTVWESMGKVIGMFGTGFQSNGKPSEYRHQVNTKGLGVFQADVDFNDHLQAHISDYWIQNVSNTTLSEFEASYKNYSFGLQFLHQTKVGQGGNQIEEYSYVEDGHMANLLSVKAKQKYKKFSVDAAYTWVLPTGRFVFPRELGFDRIYTNISRFRIEGLGNAHMIMSGVEYETEKHLKSSLKLGLILHNNMDQFEYNKYNQPQSGQLNLDLHYNFHKLFEGLELKFLYLWNFPLENISNRPDTEYNLTNFQQFNLILNYYLNVK